MKQIQLPTLNHFKVTGEEDYRIFEKHLTEYFGENCFWICSTFDVRKAKQAFHTQEKKGDTSFQHFLQVLKTI